MTLSPDRRDDSTPGLVHPRFDRSLSAAIDRAAVQAEQAEAMGDTATARAWRRVLRTLERRIP